MGSPITLTGMLEILESAQVDKRTRSASSLIGSTVIESVTIEDEVWTFSINHHQLIIQRHKTDELWQIGVLELLGIPWRVTRGISKQQGTPIRLPPDGKISVTKPKEPYV